MDFRSSIRSSLASSGIVWVGFFTALVLLVHGFHPAAEDGGIYTAGIYLRLHPSLFPHDAEFVRAPMAYSQFSWLMAETIRLLHVAPAWVIFFAHIFTVALTLFAAKRVARVCGFDEREQLGSMALLTAWWTLPVAGTSLTIGDPYLTARSFSTALSVLAVSYALEDWNDDARRRRWPVFLCIASLLIAAVMHRLMFGFTAGFIVLLRARRSSRWPLLFAAVAIASLLVCAVLILRSGPESAAFLQAELTRAYWFIFDWQWFELIGLVAPLMIFAAFLRFDRGWRLRALSVTCLAAGLLSILVAAIFAREHALSHVVARLQPLRMFMLLYLLMTVMLGAFAVRSARKLASKATSRTSMRIVPQIPFVLCVVAGCCMLAAQRADYSSSRHIELPWMHASDPNPWVAAFLWCRRNTAEDALFAIDASYIHQPQDDAQTFRAIAWRSVLPDQSKDGGEAAVDSELASTWQTGMDAQTNLNGASDTERLARLHPLGVQWMVLTSAARTGFPCPYDNSFVKVCRLSAGG